MKLPWRNEDGNAVLEFALIFPVFLTIIVGGFYAALLAFTAASMQYAVEAGARCASVSSTLCSNSTAIINYTKQRYSGSAVPTFTSSSASCGHLVSGSMTYVMSTGFSTIDVPLAAKACFP